MPKQTNKKSRAIFKDETELLHFVSATIADIASISALENDPSLTDEAKVIGMKDLLDGTLSRIQMCMVMYERMRKEGLIRDIGEGVDDKELPKMREEGLDYVKRVFEYHGKEVEGKDEK